MCLGEPLAKAELFIFFVSLIRKLKFLPTAECKLDPNNYSAGFSRTPKKFKIDIIKRQ